MAVNMNSRLYRARKEIWLEIDPPITVQKGQLFFVDDNTDLPAFKMETFKEQWEELKINNNFGFITISGQ